MKTAVLIAVLLLTGCASVVSSSDRTVVIQAGAAMSAKAQELADVECNKRNLHARLSMKPSPNQFVFDCVN